MLKRAQEEEFDYEAVRYMLNQGYDYLGEFNLPDKLVDDGCENFKTDHAQNETVDKEESEEPELSAQSSQRE